MGVNAGDRREWAATSTIGGPGSKGRREFGLGASEKPPRRLAIHGRKWAENGSSPRWEKVGRDIRATTVSSTVDPFSRRLPGNLVGRNTFAFDGFVGSESEAGWL